MYSICILYENLWAPTAVLLIQGAARAGTNTISKIKATEHTPGVFRATLQNALFATTLLIKQKIIIIKKKFN